ncbi:hypothetical protein DD238_008541 [Peronospora effusa]|uniref:Jacalin-type lectin domain-containing protein n=1 Tax=Peronospora effusa TaxID=542832 RepID=A0A3M6V6Y5_9STRA|nr:hypothetical protein DD238_008541 [Peronospora effusa]
MCQTVNYFGGNQGHEFTNKANRYTNLTDIVFRASERLDVMGIKTHGTEGTTWKIHGALGVNNKVVHLDDKKIVAMEVHRAKHEDRANVVYVKFTLTNGTSIEAGSRSKDREQKDITIFGFGREVYLVGLVGRAEKQINALGGRWLDTKCVKALTKPKK